MKNFIPSIVFTLFALAAAAFTGYAESGLVAVALASLLQAAILGVMETSLSLDNAVVNSAILKDMDERWQHRFVNFGLPIAVFGMRFLFPILIVSIAAMVSPVEATRIAFTDHHRYEAILTGAHVGISGFGGAFLALVGQSFFYDPDREHLWMPVFEKPLAALGRIPAAPFVLTLIELAAVSFLVDRHTQTTFLIAGVAGMATFFAVEKLGDAIGGETDAAGKIVRAGVGGFIYLEFLDASFSFDGVIGAFAITNDIVIIALGLGIGAMFVRSMTVALVRGGTLNEYRYLEPGAFYAIAALAAIMLLSIRVEVPEVVTGLIGAGFISAAFLASLRHKRLHPEEYAEDGEVEMITPLGDVIPNTRGA